MNNEELLAMIRYQALDAAMLYGRTPVAIAMTKPLLLRLFPELIVLPTDPTLFGLHLRIMLGAGEAFIIGPIHAVLTGEEAQPDV